MTANKTFHIPSLDGIRAIAVSIVFVAHAGFENIVPGGFGVTIFFFLSGYLITTLMRQEFDRTRTIGIRNFYLRRVYRIMPPMYLVLVGVLLFQWLRSAELHAPAIVAEFAYLTNYYGIAHGEQDFLPYTNILWSLAVEEHFYIGFPLLLGWALPRYTLAQVFNGILVVCGLVLAWRCFLVLGLHVDRQYTYSATDARIDSILFGSAMALRFNPVIDPVDPGRGNARHWLALAVGAALILVSLGFRNPVFRETARYTLQGIALWPIFYGAIHLSASPLFSWLESPPMRWFGRISYTFYLVHFLAIGLSHTFIARPLVANLVAFAVAIAVSLATWFLVERPLSTLRRRLHDDGRPPRKSEPAGAT